MENRKIDFEALVLTEQEAVIRLMSLLFSLTMMIEGISECHSKGHAQCVANGFVGFRHLARELKRDGMFDDLVKYIKQYEEVSGDRSYRMVIEGYNAFYEDEEHDERKRRDKTNPSSNGERSFRPRRKRRKTRD